MGRIFVISQSLQSIKVDLKSKGKMLTFRLGYWTDSTTYNKKHAYLSTSMWNCLFIKGV